MEPEAPTLESAATRAELPSAPEHTASLDLGSPTITTRLSSEMLAGTSAAGPEGGPDVAEAPDTVAVTEYAATGYWSRPIEAEDRSLSAFVPPPTLETANQPASSLLVAAELQVKEMEETMNALHLTHLNEMSTGLSNAFAAKSRATWPLEPSCSLRLR